MEAITEFHPSPAYHHYLEISVKMLFALLRELGVFISICLVLVAFGITRRFLSIKLGVRVKPDARKAILVTGATSGIGLTVAKHFYKLGFSVIGGYFNDQEAGYEELRRCCDVEEASGSVGDTKAKMLLVKMDVRSEESISSSAEQVRKFLESNGCELYCLVNNAGTSKDGPFEWCCRESINDLVDTNLKGIMMVTREFIMDIISNRGRVVNVGSGVFLTPMPSISVYGGCKSAVSYFSASLNDDIKNYGASSVCLLPGNLIPNSNIIYPRIRCLQESLKKLSDKERALYQKSISVYQNLLHNSLRNKLKLSGDDPNRVGSLYNIEVPEFPDRARKRTKNGKGFLQRLLRQLDGSTDSSLEHSGILMSFEDAVCLVEPPQSLFAGNFVYSYITGPSIEYWPRVMYGILTRISLNSLRK